MDGDSNELNFVIEPLPVLGSFLSIALRFLTAYNSTRD